MATVTKDMVYMDDGMLVVSIDYDDVDLTILSVNATNTNERDYSVSVMSTATQVTYNFVITPCTLNQPLPQDVVNEIALTVRPGGRIDGAEWSVLSQAV